MTALGSRVGKNNPWRPLQSRLLVGLEPEFGEAYLIPRKVKGTMVCCFSSGINTGKRKRLRAHIAFLESREVYAEDEFFI